jgi:2-polyprenyl-3-methyl-5-hydroxy-6-metoxy-1,4-benzoquinol methylase
MNRKVDPSLYTRDYFEAHCRGQEKLTDLAAGELLPIFARAVKAAGIQGGERVLDYGCGRGELVFHCAQKGCTVSGLDVSEAAVEMSRETMEGLPAEAQARVDLKAAAVDQIDLPENVFDVIFMIDVFEHLYDWELDILMPKFFRALKPGGKLVLQTPNWMYENALYPAKRVLQFPLTLIKETGRVIRRTGKRKDARAFFTKLFKFQFHDDPIYKEMHINVQTPWSLGRRLKKYGFQSTIECVDHSQNPLSLLFNRWAGRTIDALAVKPGSAQ